MPATYRGGVTQRALAATVAAAEAHGIDTSQLGFSPGTDPATIRSGLASAAAQAGLSDQTADLIMGAAANATRRRDAGAMGATTTAASTGADWANAPAPFFNPRGREDFTPPRKTDFIKANGMLDEAAYREAYDRASASHFMALPPYPYRSIKTRGNGEQLSFLPNPTGGRRRYRRARIRHNPDGGLMLLAGLATVAVVGVVWWRQHP